MSTQIMANARQSTAEPLARQGRDGFMARAKRAAQVMFGSDDNDPSEVCREVSEGARLFSQAIEAHRLDRKGRLVGEVDWTVADVERTVNAAMTKLDREHRESLAYWVIGQVVARNEFERIVSDASEA